jgi:hypothetical protein
MKNLELQIDDSIYENVLKFLEIIPADKIRIIEEKITDNLLETKKQAMIDLENNEAINWNDAKKDLGL